MDSLISTLTSGFVFLKPEDRELGATMDAFRAYAEQWLRLNPVAAAEVRGGGAVLFFTGAGSQPKSLGDVAEPQELSEYSESVPVFTASKPKEES